MCVHLWIKQALVKSSTMDNLTFEMEAAVSLFSEKVAEAGIIWIIVGLVSVLFAAAALTLETKFS